MLRIPADQGRRRSLHAFLQDASGTRRVKKGYVLSWRGARDNGNSGKSGSSQQRYQKYHGKVFTSLDSKGL